MSLGTKKTAVAGVVPGPIIQKKWTRLQKLAVNLNQMKIDSMHAQPLQSVLFSIKNPYSDFILAGLKRLELRKSIPAPLKEGEPYTGWIYNSGKDGDHAIVGKFMVEDFFRCEVTYDFMYDALPKVLEESRLDLKGLVDYLPCYALQVHSPKRFAPVHLSRIGLSRPPQSWQYLTREQAAILYEYENIQDPRYHCEVSGY